jgi:hypothetical protein
MMFLAVIPAGILQLQAFLLSSCVDIWHTARSRIKIYLMLILVFQNNNGRILYGQQTANALGAHGL